MKKTNNKNLIALFGIFIASLFSLGVIFSGQASAATKTWDGEGADDNFNTAANWSGDSIPVNGDTLVFPASVDADTTTGDDRQLTNNISNLSVAGIQFTGTFIDDDYDQYTISGNALTVTDDITVAEGTVYFLTGITITQDIAITSGDGIGSISFGNYETSNIDFNIGGNTVTASKYLVFYSRLVGSGSLALSAGAGVYTDSPNFTGSVSATGNKTSMTLAPCTNLNSASGISIGANSVLFLNCNLTSTVAVPITIQGTGYSYENQGGDTEQLPALYMSQVNNTSQNANIKITKLILGANSTYGSSLMDADDKVTVTELVANGHSLSRIAGSGGILIVNGKSVPSTHKDVFYREDYTPSEGDTSIFDIQDKTRAVVTGKYLYPFNVKEGGILAGTGQVANVTVRPGGIVAPGLSPGTLTTGSITWEAGGIYEFEIGKAGADQIKVNGSVTLGNGTLSLLRYQDYAPVAGAKYTIIDNDGSDAVSGTFKDLPEGATFNGEGGGVYRINYAGGDGNDVVITVVTSPGVPDTGFAMITRNPLLTLGITTSAAVAIIAINKRRNTVLSR